MERYFNETLLLLTCLSALVVPEALWPVTWAITLFAITYRARIEAMRKDDTPEVKRFRDELKDLKAKVDAMIIGGRVRGG